MTHWTIVRGALRSRRGVAVLLALLVMAPAAARAQETTASVIARGNAAFNASDYRTALAHYEQALSQDPSLTDLYFFLGNSYDNLYRPGSKGDLTNEDYLARAVEFYGKASEVAETPSIKHLAQQYLVHAYISRDKVNDPAQAEPLLLRMIETDVTDPANYFRLSQIYEDAGDYARAEQQLTLARANRPQEASVYMNLAGFYQRRGNFDKTIETLQEHIRQEPDNPEAHYTLATFYWEKASRDSKLSDAQKLAYVQDGLDAIDAALDRKPDYFEALTYKNLLLRTQGNIAKSPAERQRLLEEADELRKQAEDLRNTRRSSAVTPVGK